MQLTSDSIRVRKELYGMLRRQVEARQGRLSSGLFKYQSEFESDCRRNWKLSNTKSLFQAMYSADIVLLGDFHGHYQSQKSHLRILQKAYLQNQKIIIGVECIAAKFQPYVNKYLAGKISEEMFLKKINWEKRWGFPWNHYKIIFDWARQNNINIIALNSNSDVNGSLLKRDKFVAKNILNAISTTQCQLFVIIGEWHLANAHLPVQLENLLSKSKNKYNYVRVFQNCDDVYFKQLKKIKSDKDNLILAQNKSTFCVLNVPPWVKWLNYLMYIEQKDDFELNEEDFRVDYTDHVCRFIKLLSMDLHLSVPIDNLSVYTASDESFWKQIDKNFTAQKATQIKKQMTEELSFFIPELGVAFLSRPTVNHAAGLAMQYIHFYYSQVRVTPLFSRKEFLSQVWINAISYFGSKIINPKRKTDTLYDIQVMLNAHPDKSWIREPLQVALSQRTYEKLKFGKEITKFAPKRKISYLLAAKILGEMLGERLYKSIQLKKLNKKDILSYLQYNFEKRSFRQFYYRLIQEVEVASIEIKSKKELL